MLPVVALTIAVASSLPAVGALADTVPAGTGPHGGHAVHVTFRTDGGGSGGPSAVLGVTCDLSAACLLSVASPPTASPTPTTGDVQATGVLAGAAQIVGTDVYATALNTLVGHVDGCGSGTLTITYRAHYPLGNPSDLGGGEWEIVEGTGTGALAGAWGSGTFTVTSLAADQSSTDLVTGLIHC
jgi:hypothetical protein